MRVWEQRVRVFAPAWEWAPLERVWCQVSASVFPARRWFRAFARFLGPVRRARVYFPEQESVPLVPVFVVAWESVRGALE